MKGWPDAFALVGTFWAIAFIVRVSAHYLLALERMEREETKRIRDSYRDPVRIVDAARKKEGQ